MAKARKSIKGTTKKPTDIALVFFNILVVVGMIALMVAFVTILVNNLIGKPYSICNIDAISTIEALAVCGGLLLMDVALLIIVNKKVNLFDYKYPSSRKYCNFFFLLALIAAIQLVWTLAILLLGKKVPTSPAIWILVVSACAAVVFGALLRLTNPRRKSTKRLKK